MLHIYIYNLKGVLVLFLLHPLNHSARVAAPLCHFHSWTAGRRRENGADGLNSRMEGGRDLQPHAQSKETGKQKRTTTIPERKTYKRLMATSWIDGSPFEYLQPVFLLLWSSDNWRNCSYYPRRPAFAAKCNLRFASRSKNLSNKWHDCHGQCKKSTNMLSI